MNCKVCGKELKKGAKFCTECGTKVTEVVNTTEKIEPEVTVTTTTYTPVNKGKAVASLVIGIISFFMGSLFLPLPIIGLALGLSQKEKCGEKTAGIIINAIMLVISIISWIFVIVFLVVAYKTDTYESREENDGSSDIIINDNGNTDYDFDYNDYFDYDF